MKDKEMKDKEFITLLETQIEELKREKRKLQTIIEHLFYVQNVTDRFVRDLIDIDNGELNV